jgi:hypothetical protein
MSMQWAFDARRGAAGPSRSPLSGRPFTLAVRSTMSLETTVPPAKSLSVQTSALGPSTHRIRGATYLNSQDLRKEEDLDRPRETRATNEPRLAAFLHAERSFTLRGRSRDRDLTPLPFVCLPPLLLAAVVGRACENTVRLLVIGDRSLPLEFKVQAPAPRNRFVAPETHHRSLTPDPSSPPNTFGRTKTAELQRRSCTFELSALAHLPASHTKHTVHFQLSSVS